MADRPNNTVVGSIKNGFLARMMRFSPASIVVWLALANRADENGNCHPSINTLREDTGLARDTVYKGIDELVEKGEISVVSGGGKGNPSNQYEIKGSPAFGLVQNIDQSNPQTKVVQSTDKGSPAFGLKPDTRTKQEPNGARSRQKKFVKPTIEDVAAYCHERKNNIDAQRFIDSYESRGWLIGKSPMKDWKAAVRTWERNDFNNQQGNGVASKSASAESSLPFFN